MEPLEEELLFKKAQKWLRENGTFKKKKIETKESHGIYAETENVIFRISFKRPTDCEPEIIEGEDVKKMIIDMYNSKA